ncbi:MAG: helix-turn-helix transcriptional regulator [Ilumatobacteraceae bacterium]|jgi:MerR family transcriptional regulator, heat shock protein HspR|nr:helix-turn-helix transcriptional regulator [Ilumatobacteraceae bacterium]MDP4701786.1 helix-turn-helix transcriptional regulator [Ilumatobacteraceae bacterium]MDP5108457.1 helix-turn-helix transcriptional regulator [Ilumatobacteraceae bacterium]
MATRRTDGVPVETVYVISVAAELAGVHPQTLRIYERRGLVTPGRTSGGNRRYSEADIARLKRVAELAAEGMNLEGIRHVMQLEDEIAQLRALVVQLQEQITGKTSTEVLRGELVPLRQAVAVFRERPSIFNKDRY